jgi:thioesterase domain-containing protein
MGGIIAYEIAQQLAAQGEEADLLGLIDTWPPTTIPNKLWTSRLGQQIVFLGQGVSRHLRAMWMQPRGQRLRYLREKAGIITEMVAQRDVYRGEQYTLYSDLVTRANQHAASQYAPKPYPGSLFLIVTSEQAHTSDTNDLRLSWRAFAQGGCTIRTVPGKDSGTLLKPPFVQGLADAVREQIEQHAQSDRDSMAENLMTNSVA